jgi:hypothetical protein
MKFKKFLSLILAACLIISMLSVFAFAEPEDDYVVETDASDDTASEGEDGADGQEDGDEETTTPDGADVVVDAEHITGDGTTGNVADLSQFTLASENDNLAFYVNDINGFFALYYKKTGAIWYSNPIDWEKDVIAQAANKENLQSQLIVTYLNSSYDIISVASCQAHIVSEHDGNKQIMTYVFSGATRNFSIPVAYELKEDYLDVQILVEDIEENSDARITQITLLPFLGAGGLADSGYALIPDGSGSLMEFNKICKNLSQYTGYIYNRDVTASSNSTSYVDLNETISLPVYGIQKNGAAYLSVITQGAGTAAIKCNVSKMYNSYNSVSSHLLLRDTQTRRSATGTADTISMYYSDNMCGNMSMRIYPLDKDNSNYVGMAKRYRQYLIDEEGLSPLDGTSSYVNSLNINLFGAVKSPMHFLGIPYTGVKALTTFSDVKSIIDDLKGKDINNLVITMSGWSGGGLESAIDMNFSPESKLGGMKGAKDLIAYAEEQGVNLIFDNDVQSFYSGSSQVKKFKHTAYSLAATPVTVYPFSKSLNRSVIGDKFNHLIHPKYMVEFANTFVDNALKVGIKNFSFNTAGTDPYAAYNDDSMVTRDKSADLMKELFKNVADKTDGIVSTRVGNSFVLGSVDNIVEAPVYSSSLIMAQTSVPFYQIALRGYVNMSAEAMNLSSEVSELELKCAESGLSLYYQLMDADSTAFQDTSFSDYYACSYDDYFEIMTSAYGRMKAVYDAVGASSITNHEIRSDTLRVTTFSNGAKVYVNYGDEAVTVDNIKIDARAYTAVGGAK